MNPQVLPQEEFFTLLEEALSAGGEASFTPTGVSMLPMLRSGVDTVVLRRPTGPLKKYDLPLYRRENGQYVLHRVVGQDERGYQMRGDHQLVKEYGIADRQIIGVVTAFVRDGKCRRVTDWRYRLYCRLWANAFTIWLRQKRCALRARLHRKNKSS